MSHNRPRQLQASRPLERLLILGCSAAKRPTPGRLPALERYNGPMFRIFRKAQAEGQLPAATWLRIISARYGLLAPEDQIPDYDQVITPERADQLAPQVSSHLQDLLAVHPECRELFISLGRIYLPTIVGCQEWAAGRGITVITASGGIWERCRQLKEWLYAPLVRN